MATIQDEMPTNYGYVVLAVAGGSLVNIYLIVQVAKARKQYGVMVSIIDKEITNGIVILYRSCCRVDIMYTVSLHCAFTRI